MADRVQQVLEKTVDELQFYIQEDLFSKRQVKKIVKQRREMEYQMMRKDAEVRHFLEAINYEKALEKKRSEKKTKLQKQKEHYLDHCIRRRIVWLYERMCRKFKEHLPVWKEYLEHLVREKSFQKLNRALSKAVQLHPHVLQFWLIGVYAELDLRGNIFASRNLML